MSDYTTWKVGDKVVCVKRAPWRSARTGRRGYGPGFREICSIRGIKAFPDDKLGILLDGYDEYYIAVCFRRVVPRKTDISVFTAILKTNKADA